MNAPVPTSHVETAAAAGRQQVYEIRVEGHLSERWCGWFEGLAICAEESGETLLRGPFPDQAALFGVLNKVHALNLVLVSVIKGNSP